MHTPICNYSILFVEKRVKNPWGKFGGNHQSSLRSPAAPPDPAADFSQKLDPVLEIPPIRQADLLQQSPERLPDGDLPGYYDPPVLLVLLHILIVEIHEVPDIEGHEAAFFLDGKGQLFAVGFPFSFQILGVNDIKSPLP